MIIKKLKLDYFGQFHNKELDFMPGINIVYGENEAGKSTLHTFIKGMLFGIERMRGRGASSKEDIYHRFLPWDYPGAYLGSMDIVLGEEDYRLIRNFHANNKDYAILNLKTGREITLKEGNIRDLIPGLTESTYRNTVSMEQLKAQTDPSLAAEVRDYITNLSIAKNKEVNVTKALNFLTEQKKLLESSGLKLEQDIKLLRIEIENEIETEGKIDNLSEQLKVLIEEEYKLKNKLNRFNDSKDKTEEELIRQFPAILVKFHTYEELLNQCSGWERKLHEYQEKLQETGIDENKEFQNNSFSVDIELIEQLTKDQIQKSRIQSELQIQLIEDNKRYKKKRILLSILPVGIVLLILLILKSIESINPGLIGIGIIISLTAGGLIYRSLLQQDQKKQQQYEDSCNANAKQLSKITDRVTQILMKYNVSSLDALSIKKEEITRGLYEDSYRKEQVKDLKERLNNAEDKKDMLYDTIMTYMQHFINEDDLTQNSMLRLEERVELKNREISEKRSYLYNQCETNRLQVERLKWEIKTMEGNEEKLLVHKSEVDKLEQKQKENDTELAAVNMALHHIKELSVTIHDTFGLKLNKVVSDMVNEVTDGKYSDIKVDEKFNLKVNHQGTYIPFERLSAGTTQQIYLALRLAVAELLLEKENMPLLLDDSFALYDDNRVKAALSKLAGRKQVILFSCHNREMQLLDELMIPYNYINLSCP